MTRNVFEMKRILCFVILCLSIGQIGVALPYDRLAVKIVPNDLRVQNLEDPVGIDERNPQLSWKIKSNKQDIKQTDYRVVVATSKRGLDQPDIWDSGKVQSDKNIGIRYAGKPLKSARKYYWKIMVWINKEEKGRWSEPAHFVTGIFDQRDWENTKWIAFEKLPDSMRVYPGVHAYGNMDALHNRAQKRAVIPRFRKEFEISKKVKEAYVFVSGLGQYDLFLNNKKVDNSLLKPTWSDYTERVYYNSFEVTEQLKEGRNTFASLVAPGFLYINQERYYKFAIAAGFPMFRLKMIIRYDDGTTQEVTTDENWKTSPSAIVYSSIYGGEDFDANKVQKNWMTSGFNDHTWSESIAVKGMGGKMQAQESYPVVVGKKFEPVSIDTLDNHLYKMIDFGQNMSGIIKIKAQAPKGHTIKITPSELTLANGHPDQRASGEPYYWQYTFKGNGAENWQPKFTYYGFRYVGVELLDENGSHVNLDSLNINEIKALHTQNNMPKTGTFVSSDTLLNKTFDLIRWGIRNNLSNLATDCPHREKLGWLEQAHLMGNSIQYNYDIQNFYRKSVRDMCDAQLSNGMIPDIAPEYVEFDDGFRDSPEWGSSIILVPWYLYNWYGDEQILEEAFPTMKRYLSYLSTKSENHLLDYGLGDWFDLGTAPPGVSQLTPLGLTASGFYFYDAKILSKVAEVLGEEKEAEKYSFLADTIKKAFNEKYLNTETKVYATGSQTSFAIPLYFGIAPQRYKSDLLTNFTDSIKQNNYSLTAGDIGFRYVIRVLEKEGYNELIYKMNNRDDVPGYGYQMKKGATALTESWQGLREVSNNHMMLGHLMEWFYSGLSGVRQEEGSVGFKKIEITPQFIKEVDFIKSTYNSVNGIIKVEWRRRKDEVELKVEIPPNSTAKIKLPHEEKSMGSGGYKFIFKD